MAKIAGLVREISDSLTHQKVSSRRMSAIARRCGRERLTSGFLRELESALHKAGVHTDRVLNSSSTTRDQLVRFSRIAFTPSEVEFGCERQLVDLVVDSVGKAPPLDDLKILKREFSLPSWRRVDLLCEEISRSRNGDIVAVEFKRGEAGVAVVEQLAEYLDELRQHRIAAGRKVRGIVLARRIRPQLALPAAIALSIQMYEYSFSFKCVQA